MEERGMLSNVYFKDGHIWECEVVKKDSYGLTTKMYSRETFHPWQKIDRIGEYRDHLK